MTNLTTMNDIEMIVIDRLRKYVLPPFRQLSPLELSKGPLIGRNAVIESIRLINFLVEIDSLLKEQNLISSDIINEELFVMKDSPLRTINDFLFYIKTLAAG